MNSWNPAFAREVSDNMIVGFLARPSSDDHIVVPNPKVSSKIRELVASEHLEPMDPATFEKGSKAVAEQGPSGPAFPYTKPHFAYALMWISELGDRAQLDGMLSYADAAFDPTWDQGGLFYPSRKAGDPFDYKSPSVDVLTGNAAVAYGRLNVSDGQRKMYEHPWDEEHFATSPFMNDVDLSSGVDFLRGNWDSELGALAVTVRSWDGAKKQ